MLVVHMPIALSIYPPYPVLGAISFQPGIEARMMRNDKTISGIPPLVCNGHMGWALSVLNRSQRFRAAKSISCRTCESNEHLLARESADRERKKKVEAQSSADKTYRQSCMMVCRLARQLTRLM